jgi:ketosteroid isomerase-like protein
MRVPITIIILTFCILGVSIGPVAAQEEEVRAAMVESLAAWSAGDFQRLGTFFAEQTRGYMLGGTILVTGFNPQALEAAVSAGFSFDIEPREIDILMAGETVAVAVAMVEGTITLPGGELQQGPWQYSETRILQDGQWRVIQYHFSPVAAGRPN